MFSKLFGKKTPPPPDPIEISHAEISFLGEPSGNGLQILIEELRKILDTEGNTRVAYLSRVKYSSEDFIRIALIISGRGNPQKMANEIGRACQTLVKIDILFLDSLSSDLQNQIKQQEPFYGSSVGA